MLPQPKINLKSRRTVAFENNQAAKEKDARADSQNSASFLIL